MVDLVVVDSFVARVFKLERFVARACDATEVQNCIWFGPSTGSDRSHQYVARTDYSANRRNLRLVG